MEWRRKQCMVLVIVSLFPIVSAGIVRAVDSKGTAASGAAPAPASTAPATPWSCLKSQPWGPFKVSFGGDARLRYEHLDDYFAGGGDQINDGLWYLRTRINIGAAMGEHLVFFLEGLDAREWDSKVSPNPQEDNMDLHQAYVKLLKPADLPVSLNVGRQKLEYGAKRLIAAPVWSNRIRSFDAVRFSYNPAGIADVDFILGNVVIYDDNNLNNPRWGENLFGVYTAYKKISGHVFDLYWLGLVDKRHEITGEDKSAGDLDRYTVGTRGEGKIPMVGNLGYGYEVVYQYGDNGPDEIDAYAYHLDVNYAFPTVRYQPKVTLEYNEASGDEDPADGDSETFVPLFQTVHEPYGIIDFFRWQNVDHYGLILDAVLHPKVKGSLQYHRFYLNEEKDAWYNASGRKIRQDKTGEADDYVGDELDLILRYQVLPYLGLEAGYAHFFAGDYTEDTGSDDDADWWYAQTVFTF